MSNSSKRCPDAIQGLENLLALKREWNGPGESKLTVDQALRQLRKITDDIRYPEALRKNAAALQHEIVMHNQAPKRRRTTTKKKESM